jgi:hypothetical protein
MPERREALQPIDCGASLLTRTKTGPETGHLCYGHQHPPTVHSVDAHTCKLKGRPRQVSQHRRQREKGTKLEHIGTPTTLPIVLPWFALRD